MNCELMGVNFLKLALAKTDYLEPHINENDKEPSWDGDIDVFGKPGNVHLKKDFICKVPIQVKGHKEDNLKKKTIKFPIEITDLKNYLAIGGTMFFVVYVDSEGENSQIYCAELLPYDLKKILNKYSSQQSRRIELKAFPKKKTEISDALLNFARNMKRQQPAINCDPVTYEELSKDGKLKEISFGYTSTEEEHFTPFDYLFRNGTYVYAKLDFGLELPIDRVPKIETAKTTVMLPVMVKEKVYYDSYDLVYKKDIIELHIGKSVKLVIQKNDDSQHFTFTLKGNLSERITDTEFIISAFEFGVFKVGDIEFPLFNEIIKKKYPFNINAYKQHLLWLKKIKSTLNILRVRKDLDFDSFTENDEANLRLLVSGIYDKKAVSFGKDVGVVGSVTVSNLKITIFAFESKEDKSKYNIHGFNNIAPDVKTCIDEGENKESVSSSHYVVLKEKDILENSNIDYRELVSQVTKVPLTDVFSSQLITLILEMLKAYDKDVSFKDELISAVLELTKYLLENDTHSDKHILTLNYYQTVKRIRELEYHEKLELQTLVENRPDDEQIFVGAYLLLDNIDAAKMHFDLMSESDKENFKKYPIYNFWN